MTPLDSICVGGARQVIYQFHTWGVQEGMQAIELSVKLRGLPESIGRNSLYLSGNNLKYLSARKRRPQIWVDDACGLLSHL